MLGKSAEIKTMFKQNFAWKWVVWRKGSTFIDVRQKSSNRFRFDYCDLVSIDGLWQQLMFWPILIWFKNSSAYILVRAYNFLLFGLHNRWWSCGLSGLNYWRNMYDLHVQIVGQPWPDVCCCAKPLLETGWANFHYLLYDFTEVSFSVLYTCTA